MNKKLIYIVISIVLLGILLGTCLIFRNTKTQEKLSKIQLNEVTRSVFYAPQYVAISEGFMKEQGLEIEITTGQGADKVMTAVLAGQSDIGFAGPEASIYVYNEGKEDYTQVFAQLTQKDGSFLISRNKNENFNWEDVKGKTIIPGRKGGVPYMTLEYILKKNGINPETEVILDDSIKFDLMAGAFSGGTADYVTLFEPTASLTQQVGKGYIVASIGEESGEIPYTAYFAKKSYIENNNEIIKKFTKAIYKAQKWVKEHNSKEIAESIQEFFPDTSIEQLENSLEQYKKIEAWKETPEMKEETFNLLQTIMEEAGELKQKAPFDKIVNNKFAIEVYNEN